MNKFDWKTYVTIAREISTHTNNDEAKYRCAISRAYYGAFNSVVSFMKTKNIYNSNPGEGSHQSVIDDCFRFSLNNQTNAQKAWRRIGNSLTRMKKMRVKADYHDCYFQEGFSGSLKSELTKAITYADDIISDLDVLRDEDE